MTKLASLRIGSRRSDLARLQSQLVGNRLGTNQFVFKEAPGDINLKDPLWKMPEMGVFTSFLRRYLESGEVDLVVHSWKDLPVEKDPATAIVATMPRADPRDLLLINKAALAQAYQTGHLVILSSSPRRKHNLPDFLMKSIPTNPDGKRITSVEFRDVRGNIQTRLSKLCLPTEPAATGLIVAKAAIDRFILAGTQMEEFKNTGDLVRRCLDQCLWQVLPLSVNPTAAAQGALAVEMLDSEETAEIRSAVKNTINCDTTFDCVNEERSILHSLGGGCHQKIGCTILRREWGTVKFLRGQTDKARNNVWEATIEPSSSVATSRVDESMFIQIGGRSGIHLFEREDIPNASMKIEKALKKSGANVGLYVAKSDAVPSGLSPGAVGDRLVWSAGVQTWFSLAKRGFWINGSSDSLGEGEPIDTYLLSGNNGDSGWIKLTHTEGSFEVNKGANEFIDIIPTYRLRRREMSLDDSAAFNGKSHFYFSSGSAFKALTSLRPDLIQKFNQGVFTAACGPGNTLDLIRSIVPRVTVAYSYTDFVRQHSTTPQI